MWARVVLVAVAALGVVGCTSVVASPHASGSTPMPTIYIRHMQGPEFCLLAALPPTPITLRINPEAPWPEHVTALDGRGEVHHTFWGAPFTGGTLEDPVVRGPDGNVAARNGDRVVFPLEGEPNINGYLVCSGNDALYVLSH